MVEGKKHKAAKKRVIEILKSKGIECHEEKPTGTTNTEVGKRDYRCDVLAYWKHNNTRVAIEVDGKVGHSTKWANHKMDIRNRALKRERDMLTIRLLTNWLVGKNKLDDDLLWDEILYQLERKV